MISKEPIIKVGIFEGYTEVRGKWNGKYRIQCAGEAENDFSVRVHDGNLVASGWDQKELARGPKISCDSISDATFTLHDVTIGIQFHWERKESQTFEGNILFLLREDGTITAINEISVERYLASVISSEMSAEAPDDLLKAHAITSRSWLVAMLEREQKQVGVHPQRSFESETEITRWYTREDHAVFDVCADDHCQRYQGITKIISESVSKAIEATSGVFLVYDNEICDARFYKACGGLSDDFENSWEETRIPYLTSVSDSHSTHPPIKNDKDAAAWILSSPDAYCNTTDGKILRQVLPSFDQETTDFFRWKVVYQREELEEILKMKSGFDFGTLLDLVPLQRGPSGRLFRLRIAGTKKNIIVGKELEIRRWLSKSHLYSGAFIIEKEMGGDGRIHTITLRGAGWGHGVGLCQIGAAVMAAKGIPAENIVKHYFRGAELKKLY